MIPILDSESIREQDDLTIAHEPISSIDLMERASKRFCERLLTIYNFGTVLILVGPGNNGGDGLAIARILDSLGKKVAVLMPPKDSKCSKDQQTNSQRLENTEVLVRYNLNELDKSDLTIDALFGSGLDRPLDGYYRELIDSVNEFEGIKVSVDMPSGMPDIPSFDLNCVFRADLVLTFQYPKLSLLLPYAKAYAEFFEVLDIGLLPYSGESSSMLIEEEDVKLRLPVHSSFTHKYERGVSLMLGGSKGMTGSIVLSCGAALYSGSGLVKALVPTEVVNVLSIKYPEVIYETSHDQESITEFIQKVDAIGIGAGMKINNKSENILSDMLMKDIPMAIDASALRMLGSVKGTLKGKVLTPHEGEFKALVGEWSNEEEKLLRLKEYCIKHECIVVLKGAYTIICDGKCMYFNPIGDAAMATAGSGDVLLGVITSLMAQGLSPLSASICGVYLHAKAALSYLVERRSSTLRATDIINNLGKALFQIGNT